MLRPGTLLGRYEIVRLIGRGGMGCVYEGLHRDLKKRVAIKTLLPSLAANQEARLRFLREGEAASRIRHPHVVDVTDVGAEGPTSYLVMEYLQGEDLSKLIARQGGLSPTQTADIMLPVAAAIATAHDQGVIHRDLKPENIFLARSTMGDGLHAKVLDFGISKVTGDRATMVLTGTGAMFGTIFYMPPEQLHGTRQVDARSDQYALGTIVYECVTGQRAYEGENTYAVLKSIAEGRYVAPRSRRPDLPESLEAVIVRAMNLEPAARFGSVKELGAALLEFATPHARILWTAFFEGSLDTNQPNSSDRIAAGRTMIFPTPTPESGRRSSQSAQRLAGGTGSIASPSSSRHAAGVAAIIPTIRVRRSRAAVLMGAGALAIAGLVVAWLRQGGGGPEPRRPAARTMVDEVRVTQPHVGRTFRVEIETDPRAATIEIDGQPAGSGALDRRLPIDGTEHVIVARAPGYRDTTVAFTDNPPPHLLTLEEVSAPRPTPTHADQAAGSSTPSTDRANKPSRQRHESHGAGSERGRLHRGGADPVPLTRTSNSAPIID